MKKKGFTLIELLIVMAVIAILIGIAIPAFRGMQDEARKSKAQGDVRVLKIAVESYYKNHNNAYPTASVAGTTSWQSTLTGATPRILESALYDPFGATSTTEYTFATDTALTTTAKYYVIFSVGPLTTGTATISTAGVVSTSNEAVWASNGHE
ncbi:MAG: type II secretion system protein [bacterium]